MILNHINCCFHAIGWFLDLSTHLSMEEMADISQTFSNALSWLKSFVFSFKFPPGLFLWAHLTISQQHPNLFITMSPNGLAPDGSRPLTSSRLSTKTCLCYDIIHNSRQDLVWYLSTFHLADFYWHISECKPWDVFFLVGLQSSRVQGHIQGSRVWGFSWIVCLESFQGLVKSYP